MGKTLRDVIRDTTAEHLDAGHLVMGQCLSAVGFVANTVPDHPGLTELPMSDVAGAYFAVGAALAGKRTLLILRYQGFSLLAANAIVNYAAKSKAIWGRPCPLLMRSIAMEGNIGPTSGSSHHSIFTRMPGMKVFAPMTPVEWRSAYDEWMAGDDVVYLSEHRGAYDNTEELAPRAWGGTPSTLRPQVTLCPISITRFAAMRAAVELFDDGIAIAVHHVVRLSRGLDWPYTMLYDLSISECGGIVLDDDYPGGVASDIAMQLHVATGARMRVLGLPERTAGFGPGMDVLPPDKERIKQAIREML